MLTKSGGTPKVCRQPVVVALINGGSAIMPLTWYYLAAKEVGFCAVANIKKPLAPFRGQLPAEPPPIPATLNTIKWNN